MMQPFFWFSCLMALAGSLAVAAANERAQPWVSPVARAVIERTRAAYAGLEGWTATVEFDVHLVKGGVDTVSKGRRTERFLNDGSVTGTFANVSYRQDEERPWQVIVQNSADKYAVGRGRNGNLVGELALPDDLPWRHAAPTARRNFEAALWYATYVGYAGQEMVSGKRCDVLEVLNITLGADTPGQPGRVAGLSSQHCYIDPDGFIVRSIMRVDSLKTSASGPDASESWDEMRVVRYDAKAKLSAADFSREAFERDAQVMLKAGESLPELQQKEFRPGERLPDPKFIGWTDKQPFRISDLQGKIVVVETWASWCHFCKEAFPFYEKIRQQLTAQDVVFVAVSFDAKAADYEKWMKANAGKYGFKFGLIDAPDARAAIREFRGSLPAFYVLGRDGKIVASYTGYGYGEGGEDPRLLTALREAGVTF